MSTRAAPRVALVTAGIGSVSGGHRYHRHLVAASTLAGFDMFPVRPRVRLALPPADIVVVDSLYAWTVAAAVGRGGPPTVALVHQHPGGVDGLAAARWMRRRFDVAVYRRCDRVIAPGPAVAASLIDDHHLDHRRIDVVPPGRDMPPGAPPRHPLRGERRLGLLNVANWLPNKGLLELLEAVARLPPDHATLHLVGRTDVSARYGRLVRDRLMHPDLVDRVVVHGPLAASEVSALYDAADVFVFPSRIEAYGSAVGEALAAGLPVVGWRTPHLRALVDDGAEGVLLEPGRVEDLASALERLAVDPSGLAVLADGARRRGARLPTWHDTTTRFFTVLARVLADSTASARPSATSGPSHA